MHIKMLIDSIMQQTTILVGQLSTAAGIRAPLSRIADQVFVDLAQELDNQGVGRRVAADMFGMALRSYQKKLRRLTESQSAANRTLWRAVLEHIRENQRVRKAELLNRFYRDGEREVGAILTDLVGSGLIYQTGRGIDAVYGVTSERDLRYLAGADDPESFAPVLWSSVFDHPGINEKKLAKLLDFDPEMVGRAVSSLISEGRLRRDAPGPDAPLFAEDILVPVGATTGWEVAVHDHFRAVANAIACKVRTGSVLSRDSDIVGGATLSFDISEQHPHKEKVFGLLADVRERINALWNEVEAYNKRHPISESDLRRVFFYFGQYVQDDDEADKTKGDDSNRTVDEVKGGDNG